MATVTASTGRDHASPARACQHRGWIVVVVAVLVAAVAVPAALVARPATFALSRRSPNR
jgi:hypothetical protein